MTLAERLASRRALVIGDVMLDEQIAGIADRISPEAPVPVVEALESRYAPGGAANVAANLAGVGARVTLCGVAGDDTPACTLTGDLRRRGIEPAFVTDARRPTTTKTRVVAHGHQIVRIDREDRRDITPAIAQQLLDRIDACLHEVDVVVISDYRKGVLTNAFTAAAIHKAREWGLNVVVDPKGADFTRYAGATAITPNTREALAALQFHGEHTPAIDQAGAMLLKVLPGTAVLITRGEEGMTLFEADADPIHIPATAREVYDVTGAGDTAAAVLALGLASGLPMRDAARLANYAAGLVVEKLGTAIVTAAELVSWDKPPL